MTNSKKELAQRRALQALNDALTFSKEKWTDADKVIVYDRQIGIAIKALEEESEEKKAE